MTRNILALFALPVFLIIHYVLAIWSAEMFKQYAVFFRSTLPIWGIALANVLFALTAIGLFWLVNGGSERNIVVGLIYVAVGLLVLLIVPVVASVRSLGLSQILRNAAFLSSGNSGLPLSGAFVLITGLFPLVVRQR